MAVELQLDALGKISCQDTVSVNVKARTLYKYSTTMILLVVLKNIKWMYVLYICLSCSLKYIYINIFFFFWWL